jgi:hypothetical protein
LSLFFELSLRAHEAQTLKEVRPQKKMIKLNWKKLKLSKNKQNKLQIKLNLKKYKSNFQIILAIKNLPNLKLLLGQLNLSKY